MALNAARQYWRNAGSSRSLILRRGIATKAGTGGEKKSKYAVTGEYAPIYMIAGFVSIAIGIGMHTGKQQLLYAPGNYMNKKKRESFPEVDTPDSLASGSHKFITKSFLRKVAHIQHDSPPLLAGSRNTPETLKSVGVKPRPH